MRVLVVDDDGATRHLLRIVLEDDGFTVDEAGLAAAALELAAGASYDIAVLDLSLPDMSGLELLPRLREHLPQLHVVVLTGADTERERVHGLRSGADDYLVKPFSIRELSARLAAVARRRGGPQMIELGGIRIDVASREVRVADSPVSLSREEFELLAHLVKNAGRTFARQELLDAVWRPSDEPRSERLVEDHIEALRSKIELDPQRPLRIVSAGDGRYRFDPEGPGRLRDAAGLWSVAADSSDDATIIVSHSTVVDLSPAAVEVLRARDRSAAVGRRVWDLFATESHDAVRARLEQQGPSPRPEWVKLRTGAGDVVVQVSTMHVRWHDQPAVQMVLWERGGESRKIQEAAIGVSTQLSDAVVIADPELRVQSFNAAAEALYGWTEEEAIGRPAAEVLPWVGGDESAAEALAAFQESGRWHGEVVHGRRDGASVKVRSSVTLLQNEAGEPIGVIFVHRPIDWPSRPSVGGRRTVDHGLVQEVRRGVDRGEFVVHYQPVVMIDDGAVVGVEALVRWRHPERGLLAPAHFIDVAETSGAIVELGALVLDEVCRQGARWEDDGHQPHLSVNLSARQLADPDVFERLHRSAERWAVPTERVWLEITETALIADLEEAAGALRRLGEAGFRLSIDDFGTGWSSLTYLREFPISALKIDRVFVGGLGTSAADAAIVTSILSLARELDLLVVAEGIETEAQRTRLADLGCTIGQGYLFGRPVPPEDITFGPREATGTA